MKKLYVHPLPVRIWHWLNAGGFVLLIVTGLQIRYGDLLGFATFETAVRLHNVIGFVLICSRPSSAILSLQDGGQGWIATGMAAGVRGGCQQAAMGRAS